MVVRSAFSNDPAVLRAAFLVVSATAGTVDRLAVNVLRCPRDLVGNPGGLLLGIAEGAIEIGVL